MQDMNITIKSSPYLYLASNHVETGTGEGVIQTAELPSDIPRFILIIHQACGVPQGQRISSTS